LVVVTIAALTGLTIWMVYSPSVFAPRYVLATLLLFTLLPARAAEYISLTDFQPRILAFGINVFTAITLVASGLSLSEIVFFPSAVIPSITNTIDECTRDGAYCSAMNEINKTARPGERVFLAATYRYWLRDDLIQCISNDDDTKAIQSVTGYDLWFELYRRGFSFLFIDKIIYPAFLDKLNMQDLPAWVKLTAITDKPLALVYSVYFSNPPTNSAPFLCKQRNSSTIWEISLP
jgi:hypothetical protein